MRTTTLLLLIMILATITGTVCAQTAPVVPDEVTKLTASGTSVLPDNALFAKPVGGLENTGATQEIIDVKGETFAKAIRVTIKKASAETTATQLTIDNTVPVKKGDALVASFAVRGLRANGKAPAQMAFLFEKSTNPWTKSVFQQVSTARDGKTWKRVRAVFTAAEDYEPGQVMTSLRFAYGPQTVEVAELSVKNIGGGKPVEEIYRLSAAANPLPETVVQVNFKDKRQTIQGFGGNFCQARYGRTEKIDAVGQYNLDNLNVTMARIGIPLNYYTPETGVYKEDGQAKAALELMQEMASRKIPIIASVWEGPYWILPGDVEKSGKVLPPEKYDDCIAALVKFLVTARDTYKAPVDYFSFNEADYGVNFKFTPAEIAAFIKKAGLKFAEAGLTTKFLVGDTANGANLVAYVTPLLNDTTLAPYLGPIAFHCWDALGASKSIYREIGELGKKYNRPVLCTEAGHDAQLWQQPNPWPSWENALRLAAAYSKTLRLTGATEMLYWTYQDNYPIVTLNGKQPYSTFLVIQMIEKAFPKGSVVCSSSYDSDGLQVVAATKPDGKSATVLVVNTVGAGTVTIKGLPPGKRANYNTLKAVEDKDGAVRATYKNGNLLVSVPARSVTVISID